MKHAQEAPRTPAGAFRMWGVTVDLDDADITHGAYLLAYHCGCAVKVVDGWAVDVTHCDEPAHEFIGTCGE